jgi:RimJ/RimL family protein N-acetyltransferase
VIDHGFREMGISKVYTRADARNTGSIRGMERLGMQLEGRLRAHRLKRDGTRADEVFYGLLRSQWQSVGR